MTSTSYNDAHDGSDRMIGALVHILALFTWIFGPVIVYAVTSDEFIKSNAAHAINWQISLLLWSSISLILLFFLVGIIGLLLLPILDIVFCIVAAIKAADGEDWSYPITLELV